MEPAPIGGPPDASAPNRLTGILRPGLFRRILVVSSAALVTLVALACIFSKTPGRTLYFFFFGPFLNVYSFGNMLNSAIPLILGGLGVSVAMQTGNLNLGGEGQIYSGAFISTITALALSPLGFFGGFLALLAGALFAGAAAALSGFFKAKWNTNELITSFLLPLNQLYNGIIFKTVLQALFLKISISIRNKSTFYIYSNSTSPSLLQ